ncbi:MAG: hypothetical protein JSR87_01330 [Proteobacteria bacterium]|nr:hypothetical protein [Pseudomonadota bacterium]MBS0572200.1 hypothetical protein [Pseudomonadota bacterium]
MAQPDCCSIAYDDHETFKAPRLRERLGSNFGGFVHIKIAEWGNSKDLANEVFYDVAGYVLDACGRPVFEMSK